MPDVDEGVGCGAVADMQFFDTEPQPVRVEADLCHADGAMETGGQAAGHDVLRDQRHATKPNRPKTTSTMMTVMQVRRNHRERRNADRPSVAAQMRVAPALSLSIHGCGTMSFDLSPMRRGNSARFKRMVRWDASFFTALSQSRTDQAMAAHHQRRPMHFYPKWSICVVPAVSIIYIVYEDAWDQAVARGCRPGGRHYHGHSQ